VVLFFSVAVAFLGSVSSSRPSIRACGSPAHGLPTPFTAGIRHHPPGPERPGCDNGSVKADQSELIIGREGDNPASERSGAAMLLREEPRNPHQRVTPDLLEAQSRVPISEEPWVNLAEEWDSAFPEDRDRIRAYVRRLAAEAHLDED
jgi:hypothetical protein